MINEGLTLGCDSWANECRTKIRSGMRSRNMVDFGELRVWRIFQNVVITDGDDTNELPIRCESEAAAILEMERIADGIEHSQPLPAILHIPASDIPVKLLTALW